MESSNVPNRRTPTLRYNKKLGMTAMTMQPSVTQKSLTLFPMWVNACGVDSRFSKVVKQGHIALRHSLTIRWTRTIVIATAKCLHPSLDNRITHYSMFLISASTPSLSTQSAPPLYAPSPVIAPFPMFPVSRCHSHCESLATMHV